MAKFILAGLFALIAVLSGCTQPEERICAQAITPAVSPEGTCVEFATPCDVPAGYTKVDSCPKAPEQPDEELESDKLCEGIECSDRCAAGNFYSEGKCVGGGKCVYKNREEQAEACLTPKYVFDSELKFCEYDGIIRKYTFFYEIRNRTNYIPPYRSKVWLKVPDIGYGYEKTIQSDYRKDRVLWEDQQFFYLDERLRGQFWEIRDLDSNRNLYFQLIFCEPQFGSEEQCTPETGFLIADGNTDQLCRIQGTPK